MEMPKQEILTCLGTFCGFFKNLFGKKKKKHFFGHFEHFSKYRPI